MITPESQANSARGESSIACLLSGAAVQWNSFTFAP